MSLSNLKYASYDNFMGRDEDMINLRKQLREKKQLLISPAISVTGCGGIGKSQLAIEYCYKYEDDYGIICWIDASRISFATEYAELAGNPLNLIIKEKSIDFDIDKEQERINIKERMNAVKLALQTDFINTNVLLVLDNVEEPDFIKTWLPNTANCDVLLTSRIRKMLNITPLELKVLPILAASELLCSHREDLDPNSTIAKEVAQKLACLPLALDIAAHYLGIEEDISLEEYKISLGKYVIEHTSQDKPKDDYGYISFTDHQDRAVRASVLESYNNEKLSADARELLEYISWCYPENIPLEWIEKATKWDNNRFRIATNKLYNYNLLLDVNKKQKLANTHSLINEVINLEVKKKIENAAIQINSLLKNVKAYFNDPLDYHNWEKQNRYAKHINNLLSFDCENYTDNQIDIAWLGNQVGVYFQQTGNYREAKPLYRKVLMIKKKVLGEEHPSTAMSINNLATLLYLIGNYDEAEPLYRKVLIIRKKVYGEEHPSTASSINNLALLLQATGCYTEAEPLYRKALMITQKVLGEEHPDTASSINNLAALLYSIGNYDEAEPLYRKALEIREKVYGEKHPDTAQSINNLAALLQAKGNHQEAEPLLRKAFIIRKKVYGEEHPNTAQSINNLAGLLRAKGNYKEAESLYRKALEIRKKVLGEEHPDTAQSINNLALLLDSKGNYDKAEPLYRKALMITQKVLGEEHPDTATSINNLAELLRAIGNYDEAEPLYRKALEIHKKVYGEEHPSTATSINNLALLFQAKGNYDEAEPLYRKALMIYKKVYGEEHPNTATSINNLAGLLQAIGNYDEAEPLYRKALEIREKVLGEEHLDTAQSINNLAYFLQAIGNYDEAEPLYLRAMKIYELMYGVVHPSTATNYLSLAVLWYEQDKNIPHILQLVERVYRILYHKLGAEHPNTKAVQPLIEGIPPSSFKDINSPPDKSWSLLSEEWGK